jgi:DNA-binding NarL/FixJ family response regulator
MDIIAAMGIGDHIRILSVDDHPLFSEGLAAIVRGHTDLALVGQAASARDAILQHRRLRPDVTLMDVRLPDTTGIEALIAIRSECASARVIMLSATHGVAEVRRAINSGARGFLVKSMAPDDIASSIREVHAGKKSFASGVATELAKHWTDEMLTPREVEITRRLAEGDRNHEIAAALSISEETVKVHVRRIMEKLEAKDRTDAAVKAIKRGIIHF